MNAEIEIVNAIQIIIDNITEIEEKEKLLVEELLLEEEEEHDDNTRNVFNALIDIVANVEQLQDDDNLFLEVRREGGPHLRTDIKRFRTLGDPEFSRHFRMNKSTFELLILEFGNHLRATGRLLRLRTGLDVCLLMSLWVLGNLSSFRGTGVVFGVSGSVVHFHYVVVIQALRELAPKFIKWPTAFEKARTKVACQLKNGFPGVVGMMDGSLIKITAPKVQKARYFDRHHNYSINAHLVCDHNLLLRHVYVGEPGGGHDGGVFLRSPLYDELLERDDLVGPDEHILADSAYTLTSKVQDLVEYLR